MFLLLCPDARRDAAASVIGGLSSGPRATSRKRQSSGDGLHLDKLREGWPVEACSKFRIARSILECGNGQNACCCHDPPNFISGYDLLIAVPGISHKEAVEMMPLGAGNLSA